MTVITQITIAVCTCTQHHSSIWLLSSRRKKPRPLQNSSGVNAFFFFGIMLVAIAVTFAAELPYRLLQR